MDIKRLYAQGRQAMVAGFTATSVVAMSLLLSSCATPLTQAERIGADDAVDACRAYVVALDSTGNFFAEDMLKGAAMGAAAGAGTAILAGMLTGNTSNLAQNAMVGAVAGGIAGAAAGYWKHKMDQNKDQAILSVNSDLKQEIGQMDKANHAFGQLLTCRKQQFADIKLGVKRKTLSVEQAKAQWAAQQGYLARDIKLAGMIDENMAKRGENYTYADQQVNGADQGSQGSVEKSAASTTQHAKPKKTVTKKKKDTEVARPKRDPQKQELAELTSSRQHKAEEFHSNVQVAKDLSTSDPGFTSGLFLFDRNGLFS